MADILLLDTCVLPRNGELKRNPLMSALLKVAAIRGMRLVITDVVLAESTNQRIEAATMAAAALRSALTKAARVFIDTPLGYYIPDPAEAAASWRAELEREFELVETDGADAREALLREAERVPPARATQDGSATGSRDSSIWLTARRLAREEPGRTIFLVSTNSRDFGDGKNADSLRDELSRELTTGEAVELMPGIAAAIARLAEAIDTQAVDAAAIDVHIQSDPSLREIVRKFVEERAEYQTRDIAVSVDVREANERHAWKVADSRLSDILVSVRCAVLDPTTDDLLESVDLVADAWLQVGPEGASVEVDGIRRTDEAVSANQ